MVLTVRGELGSVSQGSLGVLARPEYPVLGWSDVTLGRGTGWLLPVTCLDRLRVAHRRVSK